VSFAFFGIAAVAGVASVAAVAAGWVKGVGCKKVIE